MATVTVRLDPMALSCLTLDRTTPGALCKDECTTPVCALDRIGDCPDKVCRMPHVYPPQPIDFFGNIEKISSLMSTAESIKESQETTIRANWWRPDIRFLIGVGLAGTGGYFLWKLRKRR